VEGRRRSLTTVSATARRCSTASTIDPRTGRWYRGGPSAANARFTVLREIPITLAIARIGIPSARRSRRISAQSSTPNTPLPPQLDNEPGSSRVVSFRLPGGGQFPRAVDNEQGMAPSQVLDTTPSDGSCRLEVVSEQAELAGVDQSQASAAAR